MLALSVACITFVCYSVSASATSSTPGNSSSTPQSDDACDPKVKKAMEARAKAKIAADVATTEQIVKKPDSVLAMSCFNQAAGRSAEKGGSIFSGSFSDRLSGLVQGALNSSYKNFSGSSGWSKGKMPDNMFKMDANAGMNAALQSGFSIGNGGSVLPSGGTQKLDYSATGLQNGGDCKAMDDLWDQTEKEGVSDDVPYFTDEELEDMADDTMPKGVKPDSDLEKSLKASSKQGVFKDLKQANEDLPKPQVPDFSSDDSSCKVLKKAGITQEECPP